MTAPVLVDLSSWPGIVIALDADGRVRTSNGQLETAIGEAVIGRAFADLVDPEASRAKWLRIAGAATVDPKARCELVLRAPTELLDPRTFAVLRVPGGDATWLVEHPADPRLARVGDQVDQMNVELATAQRDLVREQRRLAAALAELERSNAALDEFAHAASHDLKAPLRAIADYSELLQHEVAPRLGEEHAHYVTRIGVLAAKMRGMVDAVLEYARAGRAPVAVEHLDTGALLHDVVTFLTPPDDVAISIAREMPSLDAARVPFEQVFRNLIGNAIKYRRAGQAHVRVTAAEAGDCWEFVVADDGPGIPASQQQRVWRLFQTSRPQDGTGIGLALVKRLVEVEGGRVTLQSEPGAGASFHVLWPKRRPAQNHRGAVGNAN